MHRIDTDKITFLMTLQKKSIIIQLEHLRKLSNYQYNYD